MSKGESSRKCVQREGPDHDVIARALVFTLGEMGS